MNTTQSIIIYRNPAEAQFWESGMAFPLMVALFVGFVVALAGGHLVEKLSGRAAQRPNNWGMFAVAAAAFVSGALVFAAMM